MQLARIILLHYLQLKLYKFNNDKSVFIKLKLFVSFHILTFEIPLDIKKILIIVILQHFFPKLILSPKNSLGMYL